MPVLPSLFRDCPLPSQSFLETAMEESMVTNGIVAQDAAQADALWAVRERITEALQHDGTVYKYDISLPLPQLYSLVCFLWCAHLFVCIGVHACTCARAPARAAHAPR